MASNWILSGVIVFLYIINLKKNASKIDLIIMTILLIKVYINLLDFEDNRLL